MPTPTQPPQDLLGAPMPRLEEYQKTAINIFTEHKIDPERIVKATSLMDNGVQGLLDETSSMVVVADAYRDFFGIDNAALIQLYRTYGPKVLLAQIEELVQISQQGLLPPKQDGGNEATPAETATDDDHVGTASGPAGKKPTLPPKAGGKRLKSNPSHPQKSLHSTGKTIKTRHRHSTIGKRPPSSSVAAKKSAGGATGQKREPGERRIVAHICSRACPRFMKRKHFINHATLNHKDNIPNKFHDMTCCDETYSDETLYLEHQWELHSEPTDDAKAGATPREDMETPSSTTSTPASDYDNGEY